MKNIEEIKNNYKISVVDSGTDYIMGIFCFLDGSYGSIVIGHNEGGLDHVSVAPYNHRKMPTWEQMCEVKGACWGENEEVYQIHPPKSEYVNVMKNCLHLWARVDGKRISEWGEAMRKEEFQLVDKVREKDLEYLLSRFESIAASQYVTDDMTAGIAICYGITKAYLEQIKEQKNDP